VNVRIKVCGIVHPDDAVMAVEAGVDLIGLNFVPDSPRRLDLGVAAAIAEAEIERVLRRVDLDRLQFHGEETEEEVEEVDLPVIKAIRGADLETADEYPGTILLLDHPTAGGGSGQIWNWADASELIESGHDVILAGGLDPGNVGEALEDLGDLLPWGVDVATGVEGEAHRKDPEKVARFIQAVRAAEAPESPESPE
jgi:phosphoribosylanthranilate isomerase